MENKNVQDTIKNMLGKNMKIIDCETTTFVSQEELLFINGTQVKLNECDSETLNNVLVTGEVPACSVMNDILIRAGILQRNFNIESSLTVKSTVVLKEDIQITEKGTILNSTSNQTKDDNIYSSFCSEIWQSLPTKFNPENVCPEPFQTRVICNKDYTNKNDKSSCDSFSSNANSSVDINTKLNTHSTIFNTSLSTDSGNDDLTDTTCSSSSLFKNKCITRSPTDFLISLPQNFLVSIRRRIFNLKTVSTRVEIY